MEIRIDARDLLSDLSLAQGIVESKATIPILSNLLLRAQDNHLEVAATDLEVTLKCRCSAEVLEPGGITVPARKLGAIVRAFVGSASPLSLKTTAQGRLFLQPVGERQEYHLQTLPEEDFPTLLAPQDGKSLDLPAEAFKRCISEALVSVGAEESRFSIRGGLLLLESDRLALISTDSHRLTYTEWAGPVGMAEPLRVLIPRKTLVEFLKLDGAETVRVTFRENHIFLETENRLLYSRLMDSTFPAWEKVLPTESDKRAVLDRGALSERLKRVSMVAESKTRAITLSFDPAGSLEILARNPETGDEGREFLACDGYEGEALSIVFNVDYLLEFLAACAEEKVVFSMRESNYQALLQPVRPSGVGVHKHVLMPLRFD
ncbi:MAG: DNA polymerase III subunit beta [Acidobacteriota bacterium]